MASFIAALYAVGALLCWYPAYDTFYQDELKNGRRKPEPIDLLVMKITAFALAWFWLPIGAFTAAFRLSKLINNVVRRRSTKNEETR